jgi:nucleotide-binding universal stress UspA family protein
MTAKQMDQVAARQRAELYYELHPGSPSAIRLPKLFVRSGVWIALLGHSVRNGIAGFGSTVEAALRAFDVQYVHALRPPAKRSTLDRAA